MSKTIVTEMEFIARSYEVDTSLELKPGVYMNWLQELGWEGAIHAGYPLPWWLQNNRVCVFTSSRFDKEKPIRYMDRIIARTWFSVINGSRANREFEMRRASDDKIVLRGQGEVTMLDLRTLKPIDWGEIPERVCPNGESFYNQYQPAAVTPPAEPVTFQTRRLVQPEEIDMNKHVNNGVYLRWMADGLQSFLRPMLGEGAERTSLQSVNIRFGSPVVVGQEVLVSGKLEGVGEGISRWSFEMALESGARRPAVGEMTVRWAPEWTAALKPRAGTP